jgi:murein DD-endopeptidase MepM/ murein hydrolase activator NlpD
VDPSYRYASTANGTRDPHRGVEFLNKFGTPVYAAGEGIVIFAGPDSQPVYSPWSDYYGNLVVIEHENDLYTLYAHLSDILVQLGQRVSAGDVIGEVGQTGVAIGSHLHFEVRLGDGEDSSSTENPELWLIPNPDESGRLMGAIQLSIVDPVHLPVKQADFTLQHFLEKNRSSDITYYGGTYSSGMLKSTENAGMSDLLPGLYRIALTHNGHVYERWVEVESGKLTQVVIVVN